MFQCNYSEQPHIIEPVVNAVKFLNDLGFPMENIRRALPWLTGVSQMYVAEKIGVSKAAVSNTMNKARGNVELQRQIAEIYGVPVDLIFNPKENIPFHSILSSDS